MAVVLLFLSKTGAAALRPAWSLRKDYRKKTQRLSQEKEKAALVLVTGVSERPLEPSAFPAFFTLLFAARQGVNAMKRSGALFARALDCIPGGVNSPVRAFGNVGGTPAFFRQAQGSRVTDEDGNSFIDYVGSWGSLILGHSHPAVIAAVKEQADLGLSFGAPTEIELQLAERLCSQVPGMESVRLVNSGTEAAMSAVRLARGYTGRDKIIKFAGCYHGHADSLLVKAGSGPLTLGVPDSPGVPADLARHTLTATYNDLDSVQALFDSYGPDIACLLVEPVAGNMNCVPPVPGFLEGLRALCDQHGALLVFDEVMTGFRVAPGGGQQRFGVQADLVVLGKIIGGGMPVGAFGGRGDIMEHLAPVGPVYQAGTLSGHPMTMRAGLATLEQMAAPGFHARLESALAGLLEGLRQRARAAGIPLRVHQAGAMFGLLFTDQASVTCLEQVTACNLEDFTAFFHGMLAEGIYLAPSAFEAGFFSSAHSASDIEDTLEAAGRVFDRMAAQPSRAAPAPRA